MKGTGILCLTLVVSVTAACSAGRRVLDALPFVYRVDVQQGNVITQDMVAQLQPGMEKSKVLFIMGTPLVQDVFHQTRWDYVFTDQVKGGKRTARRISLYFDAERLRSVTGNTRVAAGPIARSPNPDVTVEVPRMEPPGFFGRMLASIGIGDGKMRPVADANDTAIAAVAPNTAIAPEHGAAAPTLADPNLPTVMQEQRKETDLPKDNNSADITAARAKTDVQPTAPTTTARTESAKDAEPNKRPSDQEPERNRGGYHDPTQMESMDAL